MFLQHCPCIANTVHVNYMSMCFQSHMPHYHTQPHPVFSLGNHLNVHPFNLKKIGEQGMSGFSWTPVQRLKLTYIILLYVHSLSIGISILTSCTHFLQPSWRAKPTSWAVLRLFWITCMYVRFGFPHYWLYTKLLTTHLPRGLRGLRTSNASWQTTVN